MTACMILLSGCSENGAKPSETSAAAGNAAALPETTAAETTTTAEQTDAGERLFKGYVEYDKAGEYLRKEPNDNADKLEELTYGMMLDIYPCSTEGWYKAVLGGETTGYVKAELIKEMPHTLPFGDRLFGGYVSSDSAVSLYSEADENSQVIREIPSGTQLDIYECEYDGWYETAIANDSDGYDIGYIKASVIYKIPDYDMDNYTPDVKDIAGRWIYETQDTSSTGEYRGITVGYYTINEDGTYSYTTDLQSFENGTVKVTYEDHPDGSRTPWFIFSDSNGNEFMGCCAVAPWERTGGCLYVGQDGAQRLVPDNGNAVGGTDNASAPNEYGFYEFKNPPASGVSIAALSGSWYNASKASDVLVITYGDDIYNGNFSFTGANEVTQGYVKLEYALNPDDSQSFWYTFYTTDGKLWNGFAVSGEIPLDDLYSGQDGATHFVRLPDISDIDGVWNEADVLDSRQLIINAEQASFKLVYRGGGTLYGSVKVELYENPDGSPTVWYNFYDESGEFWTGFQRPAQLPINDLYAGQGGDPHFVRES